MSSGKQGVKSAHFRGLELRTCYNFLSNVIVEYDEEMTGPVRQRGERGRRTKRKNGINWEGHVPENEDGRVSTEMRHAGRKQGPASGRSRPGTGGCMAYHGADVSWKPISGQEQGGPKGLQQASVTRAQSRVPVATSICNGLSASGEMARGDG